MGARLAALLLAAAASSAAAQSSRPATTTAPAAASAPDSAPVVRVFQIRHADMQEISLVLPSLLSEGNVLTVDGKTRTVTVVDRPELVERVAKWLEQFDVPPHAVLVRVVLEKAERTAPVQGDVAAAGGWRYSPLAETTLEVLERGTATQSIGEDGAFEIRVKLGSVDAARGSMRFDEVAVRRRDDAASVPGAPPVMRDVFSTSLEARNKVGKVVMATRDPAADVALVLRLLALIREAEPPAGPGQ